MSAVHREAGKEGLRVFLSYTSADKAHARRVHRILSQRPNLHVFTTESLSAGENWESKLRDELARCEIFVVVLSPNSVDSKWVLHELGAAWALDKPILPIVTDREVFSRIPLELRGVKPVEIEDLEKSGIIGQIIENYEKVTASHKDG